MMMMDSMDLSHIAHLSEEVDFNLPLIIGLSSGLALMFVVLLLFAVYLTFSNSSIVLGSNFNVPGEFDDEENRLHEESSELPKLTDEERELYLLAREFQAQYPPVVKPMGESLTEIEQEHINERGIQAYTFETPTAWYGASDPSVIIEDKLDLVFNQQNTTSAILNYPLPVTSNDTVYFEVKLFYKPQDSLVSIGLSSKPYPLFTLPGHHKYSIAYDSSGRIRINEPFSAPVVFNKLQQGDVLGVGFKHRSGTIFFTQNGKKVHDAIHNLKFDLYPHIGSVGECEVSVNLGQLGFVYIEANVKKWGFGATNGAIGVPPAYGKEVGEVLDKGEELPPTYPVEEETFFGPSALLSPSLAAMAAVAAPVQQDDGNKRDASLNYKDEPKEETVSNEEDNILDDDLNEALYERRSSCFDLQNNKYNPATILDPVNEISTSSTSSSSSSAPLPSNSSELHGTSSRPSKPEAVSHLEEPQVQPVEPTDPVDEILELSQSNRAEDSSGKSATPEPRAQPESSQPKTTSSNKSNNKRKKKKGKRKGKK